jgi:hypothetical protein
VGTQGQPALIAQDGKALALTFAVQVVRGSPRSNEIVPHIQRDRPAYQAPLFSGSPGDRHAAPRLLSNLFFFSYLPPGLSALSSAHRLSGFARQH